MLGRFVNRHLKTQIAEFNQERVDIIRRYAEFNEDGSIMVDIDERGNEMIKVNDVNAFHRDMEELFNEDYIIELNEPNKEMLVALRDIVLNKCDRLFSAQEALVYDRWCELVEQIVYKD